MSGYLGGILLLTYLVDVLLLLGARRLCGSRSAVARLLAAASLECIYAGICLLPGLAQLGVWYWRLSILVVMALLAYGLKPLDVRCGLLFLLLSLSLNGLCRCFGEGDLKTLLGSVCLLALLFLLSFPGKSVRGALLPVVMSYNGKTVRLTAMEDTGNLLRDPITGSSVLIVNAAVAWQLLGLTKDQLSDPVNTVGAGVFPGLRLIPVQTVSDTGGMLVAKYFEDIEVGRRRTSKLVAFSPAEMDKNGVFQALIGGIT